MLDVDKDDQITLKDWIAYWHRRLSKNFQKSGEMPLTEAQLQEFLNTIRHGSRKI